MNKFLQPNTLENPVKATKKKKFQKLTSKITLQATEKL